MNKATFRAWRHVLWDLPLCAAGLAGRRRWARMVAQQADAAAQVAPSLAQLREIRRDLSATPEDYARIKTLRESDAYRCLWPNHFDFRIQGLEYVRAAQAVGRPTIILTAHFGSFYTIAVALQQQGIALHPIARHVDRSAANPPPTQCFERINYALTERAGAGHYIYTDMNGKIDKSLIQVSRANGVMLALLDFPVSIFPHGHQPVTLLGQASSLPTRFIDFGRKQNAVFLTAFNHIDLAHPRRRHLHIQAPIEAESSQAIANIYAQRLSTAVMDDPCQWVGMQVLPLFFARDGAAGG